MITVFNIEYTNKNGHAYGTYVCPICKQNIKSRLNKSYLSKISSCKKCSRINVVNKFIIENKFLNGKNKFKNCKKCNIELNENNKARNDKFKLSCICKECYKKRRMQYRQKESNKLTAKIYDLKRRENKWNYYLFSLIKRRYKDTDLSPEYIKYMWEMQKGLCYWFKIPMTITSKHKYPSKPSIDRIDNSKSYTKDNCVLCCYSANIGRNTNNVDDWMNFLNVIKIQIIKEYKNEI